jgi:hypothetical protein
MAIGIWQLLINGLMIAWFAGIIAVIVYLVCLARRLVLAVEKIAGKIDNSPKM